MAKQKRATKQIVKKKKWVAIVTPKVLGEKPIGESYLTEPESAIGRTVKVSLMQITGDMKTQNCAVKFQITDYKENKLNTRLIGYEYLAASIKRLVRRRMSKVDDSLVILTKDGKKIRLKPLLLTRGKVSKSIEFRLRATLKKELIEYVRKIPYEELFISVFKNRVQYDMKNKLTPIYPIRSILIRVLKEEKHHASKETKLPKRTSRSKLMVDEEKPKTVKKVAIAKDIKGVKVEPVEAVVKQVVKPIKEVAKLVKKEVKSETVKKTVKSE